MSSELRAHWSLDPQITFLNHGSFGAAPTAVLDKQAELRAQMEAEPVRFFVREAPPLWDDAVTRGAAFVGADRGGFVYVANATTGVNTVLASLTFRPGDEFVVTDHEYNACRNALERFAVRCGAVIKLVELPLPVESAEQVVAAITAAFSDRTRLLLIDHITSPTGLVMPVAELAAACRASDVEILVDGAHAPGQIELHIEQLGVDYYTGNFHKWVCTPKAAAMLWIHEKHRDRVRPLVTSHGASMNAADAATRLRLEFDWTGTQDPTAVLTIPFTLDYMGAMVDGGWAEIQRRNRELALAGRTILCEALDEIELAPPSMIASLAAVRLPDGANEPQKSPLYLDPDQDTLLNVHGIEVPFVPWPAPPNRLVRISAQLYNSIDDMQQLADALQALR